MSSFQKLFRKNESLLSIDIGSSGVKLLEVELVGKAPTVLNYGFAPFTSEVFTNNVLTKSERVAEVLTQLVETRSVADKRVAVAVPGPSVFTKRIKVQKSAPRELAGNIQLEASNFVPHDIEAVRIDYHVIGEAGKNLLDVLVVAVKNEVTDSFIEALSLAGLATAVVDVDHFAVQNMFEQAYPEHVSKTVAVVNLGARYASINICRGGISLFSGDIPVGGRGFSEAIAQELNLTVEAAEPIKRGKGGDPALALKALEIITRQTEQMTGEINRQLSFFWNASGAEEGIDLIVLTGGGALVPNFAEELARKTGIETLFADPLKGFQFGPGVSEASLKDIRPLLGVCAGMALRQPGDRIPLGGRR